MKDITVPLDEETYLRARPKPAELGVSVSALANCDLTELDSGESDFERLKREELELRDRISSFTAADRLSRGVHERGIG